MSDTPIISKDVLLKAQLPESTVDVPGVGRMRVRGLSRMEVLLARDRDRAGWEASLLTAGLVEPALTEDEVNIWREGATTDVVNTVVEAILGLSGMLKKAVEEAKTSFPEKQ